MNTHHPPPTPQSSRVGLTLSQAERRLLDDAARRSFVSASTLARQLVLNALRDTARAPEAA